MSIIVFFVVIIVFSLGLNAFYKIKDFKRSDKSLWEDGDSVCVRKGETPSDKREYGFMNRIS